MMRKIENGEPVFHKHSCSEELVGKVMTPEQFHDFAVECLMEEYRKTGAEVQAFGKGCGADFSFSCIGGNKVNVLVLCKERLDNDIRGVDTEWLRAEYIRSGNWPRVTVTSAWCCEGSGQNGKPYICGGNFCFIYHSVSVIEGEDNPPLEKNLTDVELAVRFQEAWKELDADIIAPYLDKDFHYGSAWVFDEMPCRKEYLEYLKGKFHSIRKTMASPQTAILRNRSTGAVAILMLQKGNTLMLKLECGEGRILSARMQEPEAGFELFDPEDELYQTHGDHIEAFMDIDRFLSVWLRKMMEDSLLWKHTFRKAYIEGTEGISKVSSLRYGNGPVSMLSLVASNNKAQQNVYVSSFPMMEGTDVTVRIDRVREWDNGLEATVECSVGDFSFSFFAVDYYVNKHLYQEGKQMSINLSALALSAGEGMKGFSFKGQEALDWIHRVGKVVGYEATFEEDGSVKPVSFDMQNLVSYLPVESKAPDEAEYQSPVSNLSECRFMDIDFFRGTIMIYRDAREECDGKVSVPLYFRKDMYPSVREGDPVHGWLWMTGFITGKNERDVAQFNTGYFIESFNGFMAGLNTANFDNLMPVLAELPLLKIREGYEFDAFKVSEGSSITFRGYCCRAGSQLQYLPHQRGEQMSGEEMRLRKDANPYCDEYFIQDTHPEYEVRDIPRALDYISVPFTEQGVLQAWLLENIQEFMPHMVNGRPEADTIVTCEAVADELIASNRQFDLKSLFESLKPYGVYPGLTVKGDTICLSFLKWNNRKGLSRVSVAASQHGDSVRFSEPEIIHLLVPGKSDQRLS